MTVQDGLVDPEAGTEAGLEVDWKWSRGALEAWAWADAGEQYHRCFSCDLLNPHPRLLPVMYEWCTCGRLGVQLLYIILQTPGFRMPLGHCAALGLVAPLLWPVLMRWKHTPNPMCLGKPCFRMFEAPRIPAVHCHPPPPPQPQIEPGARPVYRHDWGCTMRAGARNGVWQVWTCVFA